MTTEIEFQIMWNRLIAVVEEQAQTLIRTAFGTATREAGDLSAGVYEPSGKMIAQAVTGTPGHVNSMAKSVGHVLAKFPGESMAEGDVFITNDPWLGTGHLNDVVVVTPAFHKGILVGHFACTLHVVDIGGAGGGASRQVYEEGLRLPILKLASRGEVSESILDIVRWNVREPVQVLGDLRSEIAANEIGCRRLAAMMNEFGLSRLDALADYILERSREAMLARIRALPRGTYDNTMTTDGIDQPITLKARVTVGDDGLDVEYYDCPPMVELGYNVPYCYAEAYSCFGLHCAIAADVPNNAGSLSVIRVHIPENTILNAPDPAPVQSRALMGQLLPDLMFGCLAHFVPEKVMAEGSARLWSVRFTGGMGRVKADPALLARSRSFNVAAFQSGGMGARFAQDGLSATAFPSGVRNIPVELTETYAPVIYRRKEYRPDSGGPGQFRGGLGQIIEVSSNEEAPFAVVTSFDRMDFPARGRNGGHAGAEGRLHLSSGQALKGKGYHQVEPGQRIVIEIPGGGGYHDPFLRAPESVAEDVRNGLVSREKAQADYGVLIGADGQPDAAATDALRAARRQGGGGAMTGTDPQRDSVFVSAASLAEECASANPPVLLDIRFRHGQHDRRFAYLEAHLPGAIYVDLQNELAGRPGGIRGNRPLPEIAALQEAARSWGLRRDSRIVVYDDHAGLQAGRAWWVLRWAGLSSVRMLDGGIDAWNAAGLPVTSEVPQPIPGDIELTAGNMPVFGPDQVGDFVRDGVLLDSRGNENYRGGSTAPGEARRGHIPGAVNAPTPENLMESGLLRSAEELCKRFDLFGATGEAQIGVYCGGGVSAAHQIAVLTSLGISASLYPGSWSAWSADPTRPVARGVRPWGGDAVAERVES